MKRLVVVLLLGAAPISAFLLMQNSPSVQADDNQLQLLAHLRSRNSGVVNQALEQLEHDWHPGEATMLLESARFAASSASRMKIIGVLSRNTKQQFANDNKAWYRWIWSQDYDPLPDYAKFKSALYSRIDKRFAEYFTDTENATIRLDEIRWGGVRRDGIPPLKNPDMITANQATYLDDSNEVFGVEINGEARCYPKRILAWHEMFKDNIGGESFCGVY